jgi:hypothetical protein
MASMIMAQGCSAWVDVEGLRRGKMTWMSDDYSTFRSMGIAFLCYLP